MSLQLRNTGIALALALLAAAAAPSPSRAQSASDPVVDLTVAERIEAGQPVGEGESFDREVGQVFAVLDIIAGEPDRFWVVFDYLGTQSLIELQVDDASGLHWASLVIPPAAVGQWSVSVVYDGETLTSKLFVIEG